MSTERPIQFGASDAGAAAAHVFRTVEQELGFTAREALARLYVDGDFDALLLLANASTTLARALGWQQASKP